ncbi:MAG: hypothetical protein ACOX4J_09695 [Anaerovoracaceae bacterium]
MAQIKRSDGLDRRRTKQRAELRVLPAIKVCSVIQNGLDKLERI